MEVLHDPYGVRSFRAEKPTAQLSAHPKPYLRVIMQAGGKNGGL